MKEIKQILYFGKGRHEYKKNGVRDWQGPVKLFYITARMPKDFNSKESRLGIIYWFIGLN
jgi:hypothetical protein